MSATGSGARLRDLRFPTSNRKPYPGNLARGAGFVLAASTALFTGGLALSQALSGVPIQGPGGLWGSVLFLGAVSTFAALLSTIPLRIRGFRVQDGIMTLVTPVRTTSGRRIRHVPLEQITHAERIAQPDADPGILVTLGDGTKFPVFEADLRGGGGSFFDELLAVLGERESSRSAVSGRDLP